MKKIIVFLFPILLYSCGPSACQCSDHYEKYRLGLGSSEYRLDYDQLQSCFKIAESTGRVTAPKGTERYGKQVSRILKNICND